MLASEKTRASAPKTGGAIDDNTSKAKETLFTKFPLLPIEIRRIIWEHTVPNPRNMFGAVVVISNFELACPRAILTSPRSFDKMYSRIENGEQQWLQPDHGLAIHNVKHCLTEVLNLLHACPESRHVALRTFRLDCDSIIAEENKPWWNEEDKLYFTRDWLGNAEYEKAQMRWISGARKSQLHHFASVRHIAMHCTRGLLDSLSLLNEHADTSIADLSDQKLWDYRMLQNLPALSRISLLFDPMRFGDLTQGCIKLYEPYDVVVEQFNRKPSELKNMVTARLEEVARLVEPKLDVPMVECAVMCWKKPKGHKSGGKVARVFETSEPSDVSEASEGEDFF